LTNLTLRLTTVRGKVAIGDAAILYSGLVPQLVGLYQINVVIPTGVQPTSQVPVIIQMGNVTSRRMSRSPCSEI
jgi:uncharacterized protein (TIGR03437 family)